MPKLSVSISRVSDEGLKLVILSAYLFLNLVGVLMTDRSLLPLFLFVISMSLLLSFLDENPHFFIILSTSQSP